MTTWQAVALTAVGVFTAAGIVTLVVCAGLIIGGAFRR